MASISTPSIFLGLTSDQASQIVLIESLFVRSAAADGLRRWP
jgi:hypothetical protein